MEIALFEAKKAARVGEVPIGAVIRDDVTDTILVSTHNKVEQLLDPTAHAEILAIREATSVLGTKLLSNCTIFVTLEPCAMCAGAMVHGRIKRVVYGADDLKTGAARSVIDLLQHPAFNHQLEVSAGVLANECAEQLSAFFKRRRAEKKALKLQAQK